MASGSAPRITAKVKNNKTGRITVKDISYELHHTGMPQRQGGKNMHANSNLTEIDPWQHAAVDTYRKVGYELIEVVKGVGTW